jgi:hypothetical protein
MRPVVKVIWEDFVWFILIFHLSHHSCRRSRWYWRCWDASSGSLFVARRAVSSANVAIVLLFVVGGSPPPDKCLNQAVAGQPYRGNLTIRKHIYLDRKS